MPASSAPAVPKSSENSAPPPELSAATPGRLALWFWNNVRKVIVLVVGVTLIAIGVALLVLPGPGWLTIFGGLALLATEFAWARWLLKRAKRKFNQVKDAAVATWNHTTSPPKS
jgi:hypothetical protein